MNVFSSKLSSDNRESAIRNPKWAGIVAIGFTFALCGGVVQAQQPKKMARIGYLSAYTGPHPALPAFKAGLSELGWIEGKNITLEYRYAGGQGDKYSDFATELVRLKVDVIVAGPGNGAPRAAKRATAITPIVMVAAIDPVGNGLVASLARPGANITGITWEVTREQAGKNLELLKEVVPTVSRVAILRNPSVSTHIDYGKEAERAAKMLGVTIRFAEMRAPNDKDLEKALDSVVNERANALLVTPHPFFIDRRQRIINFTAQHKLAAVYGSSGFVDDGGLMSYGPSGQDTWRRAAWYVEKVLKGTKPVDLPVEQPTKFEFIINMKTANQIGLSFPQSVLYRATKVIR